MLGGTARPRRLESPPRPCHRRSGVAHAGTHARQRPIGRRQGAARPPQRLGLRARGVAHRRRSSAPAAIATLRAALTQGEPVAVVVGVAEAAQGVGLAAAMAAADQALAQSEAAGPFTASARPCAGSAPTQGQGDWQRRLLQALDEQRSRPRRISGARCGGRATHLDCPLRVQLQRDGAFEVGLKNGSRSPRAADSPPRSTSVPCRWRCNRSSATVWRVASTWPPRRRCWPPVDSPRCRCNCRLRRKPRPSCRSICPKRWRRHTPARSRSSPGAGARWVCTWGIERAGRPSPA